VKAEAGVEREPGAGQVALGPVALGEDAHDDRGARRVVLIGGEGHQPALREHPHGAAHGERPATEAEEHELVAGPERLGQPAVDLAHVLAEVRPERPVEHPADRPAVGADAREVARQLVVGGREACVEARDVGVVGGGVPGAVAGDDETPRHAHSISVVPR